MAFKPGCSECGSFAINHQCHGRDGADGHLCDVCYWRTRAEIALRALQRIAAYPETREQELSSRSMYCIAKEALDDVKGRAK